MSSEVRNGPKYQIKQQSFKKKLKGVILNRTFQNIFSLILGALVGAYLGERALMFQFLGDIFFKAISMTVVPVVFVSMVCGIITMSDPVKLGKIALKTLIIYIITMAGATFVALMICERVFHVGRGVNISSLKSSTLELASHSTANFTQSVLNLIPNNMFSTFVDGNIVQVILLAFLTGISLVKTRDRSDAIIEFFNSLMPVIFKFVEIVMKIAPFGVFGLMAVATGTQGTGMLSALFQFLLANLISMVVFAVFVYGAGLFFIAKLNPKFFFLKMLPVQAVALSTASSAATLPINIRVAQEKLGVSKTLASFILPLGATINMNGLSVYMGAVAIFASNLFGIHLNSWDKLTIIFTSTVASIGCAGVPAAGLIVMPVVLSSIGVPLNVIGILASVDRLIDMFCTVLNITGDTFAAIIVAKGEKKLKISNYKNL